MKATVRARRVLGTVSIGSMGIFFLTGLGVRRGYTDAIDNAAVHFSSDNGALLLQMNRQLDGAASPLVLGLATAGFARWAWRKQHSWALVATVCIAPATTVALADHVFKSLMTRHFVVVANLHTWPSGTAGAMTAFGTCALLILWESGRPRSIGLIDVLLAVAPLTIVSVALILTGYHYVTDLAGGTALGLGTTCGIALLFGARNLGDPPRQEPMGPSAGVTHDTLSP